MSVRMDIMKDLTARKEAAMKGSPCPSCRLSNNCYMDQGKSATLCWCMEEPKAAYVDLDIDENCYCKSCLKEVSM